MGQSHSIARGSQIAANYVHNKSSQSSSINNIPSSNGAKEKKNDHQTVAQTPNRTGVTIASARAKFESRVGLTTSQLAAIKKVGRTVESAIEDPDVQAAVASSPAIQELSDALFDPEHGDQRTFNVVASNVWSYQESIESEGFVGHPGTIPNPTNPFYKQIVEKIITPLTVIGVIAGGVVMGGTVMNAFRSTSFAQRIMDSSYEYFTTKFVDMFSTMRALSLGPSKLS